MLINHIQKIKNIKHLDTILKGLSFLCAFYVLDNLYSAITENLNNKVELSNILNFCVKVFQNIVFGLLLTNLFFKFKYRQIGYIMPVAYIEQSDNFLSNQLHYYLLNSGFYNFFSDNPGMISPEYPRVIIFLFILIVSFGLLFTKWKDFKRTFLVLGASGVFFTALVFHTIIIYEITAFKNNDSKIMENIAFTSQNSDDISKACIINQYDCFFFPASKQDNLFIETAIPESIKIQLPYLKPYFLEDKEFFWYGISHEPHAQNRIIGQTPFALAKNENFSVIIKNGVTYKDFLVVNQYVFVWLSIASHLTWFLGCLFLIHFHEKRFRKKTAKVDNLSYNEKNSSLSL